MRTNRGLCRRRPLDEGVAAVELVILAPLFIGLVLAAIDFGLAFRQQIILRNAASNAAAYASVQPCNNSQNQIANAAESELQNVSVLQPTPSPTPSPVFLDQAGSVVSDCTTAYQVRVTVSAPYKLLSGTFLHALCSCVPTTVNVSGQETARIEGK